jgi:hypothetical protein
VEDETFSFDATSGASQCPPRPQHHAQADRTTSEHDHLVARLRLGTIHAVYRDREGSVTAAIA